MDWDKIGSDDHVGTLILSLADLSKLPLQPDWLDQQKNGM